MKSTNSLSTKDLRKTIIGFLKHTATDLKNYMQRTTLIFSEKKQTTDSKNNFNQKEKTISIRKSKKFQNMSNLRNSVQLIGRLGKNPEVKQLESGRFVANVSIATNDIYKNAKGEKVIETQWHNLVAWGKNAENFQKILVKGDEVAIQGKLTHRSYEDKEGITRYVTEVVVNEFVKLNNKVPTANVA